MWMKYCEDTAKSCQHLNFCLRGQNRTILRSENPEKLKILAEP